MSPLRLVRPVLAAIILVALVGTLGFVTWKNSQPPAIKPLTPYHVMVPNVRGVELTLAKKQLTDLGLTVVTTASAAEGTVYGNRKVVVIAESMAPGVEATRSTVVTLTTLSLTAHSKELADRRDWEGKVHGMLVLASGVGDCLPCHKPGGRGPQCSKCHEKTVYSLLITTTPEPIKPAAAPKKPVTKPKAKRK